MRVSARIREYKADKAEDQYGAGRREALADLQGKVFPQQQRQYGGAVAPATAATTKGTLWTRMTPVTTTRN